MKAGLDLNNMATMRLSGEVGFCFCVLVEEEGKETTCVSVSLAKTVEHCIRICFMETKKCEPFGGGFSIKCRPAGVLPLLYGKVD
jgi:hypothetical protein